MAAKTVNPSVATEEITDAINDHAAKIDAIDVPDVSGFATTSALNALAARVTALENA